MPNLQNTIINTQRQRKHSNIIGQLLRDMVSLLHLCRTYIMTQIARSQSATMLLHECRYHARAIKANPRYIIILLRKHRKYITVYRSLLVALLLPGLVAFIIGGQFRKYFMMAYMALALLTFIVEILLFVFQFTRRENFWTELTLLLMLIPVAFLFF